MTALVKKDTTQEHDLSIIEQVVMQGDLSKLNPEQRVTYYRKVCESAGLNPYTRPFDYINLNGKLSLYAKKDATEQLRKLNGISIEKLESQVIDDLYIVKATAKTKDGRTDEATGAVTIGHLKGDAKANAIMKAETKAKRRVTLSISGMGWTDESELETIPTASAINVDLSTGEIQEAKITVKPAAKQVQVQEVKKPKPEEIEQLSLILNECEPAWVKKQMEKIKQLPDVKGLSDINSVTYTWLLSTAYKNRDEYATKIEQEIAQLEEQNAELAITE